MTRLGSPLRRGWNALVALVLQARGRRCLRRGDGAAAVRLLAAAVARSPGSFAPLLHLTRAHLRRSDLALARGALALAREASPARFQVEAARWVRAEGYDLTTLTDVPAPVRADPPAVLERVEREPAVLGRHARARGLHPLGDCRDLDEYTRFRSMPPISRGEIEDVDWDVVAEDLQDG